MLTTSLNTQIDAATAGPFVRAARGAKEMTNDSQVGFLRKYTNDDCESCVGVSGQLRSAVVIRPAEFALDDRERSLLVTFSLDSSRVGVRARIVLACAEESVVYAAIARQLDVSIATVHSVRRRFAAEGIDGLLDRRRSGRPKARLELTVAELAELERLSRRSSVPQALAQRCRIVLGCAGGLDNKQVADREGVSERTVAKWRSRFISRRLDGLFDLPRTGRGGQHDYDASADADSGKHPHSGLPSVARLADQRGRECARLLPVGVRVELRPVRRA